MLVALTLTWTCGDEQQRVRAHLEGAYTQLTTVEPEGLSPSQKEGRRQALAVLREYIDRGVYPQNPGPGLTPIFVDTVGTRCAMGEVVAKLGGAFIVEHIARTRNLATVGVLADEPGLLEWLDAHGLAPEEAALVQPSYVECLPERLLSACGAREPSLDGGVSSGRARVAADGGAVEVERFSGADGPLVLTVRWGAPRWPEGMTYLWAAQDLNVRALVRRSGSYVSKVDLRCGAAPTLTPDEAREVLLLPREACLRTLLRKDPRWALHVWSHHAFGSRDGLRGSGEPICDDSGALLPEVGGPRVVAENWLEVNGLADAGIDLSDYDAWLTEQPGPPKLDPILLEAPPPLPLQGCSGAPGLALLGLVVWAQRRATRR